MSDKSTGLKTLLSLSVAMKACENTEANPYESERILTLAELQDQLYFYARLYEKTGSWSSRENYYYYRAAVRQRESEIAKEEK